MKKILTILGVTLMSFTYAQTTNTQTTESNNEFSKWQIRLRAVAVVPNEGDNLDNAKVMVKKNIIPELDITISSQKTLQQNWF